MRFETFWELHFWFFTFSHGGLYLVLCRSWKPHKSLWRPHKGLERSHRGLGRLPRSSSPLNEFLWISVMMSRTRRISPKEVFRFDIPLCCMVYMPLVYLILAYDIKKLEAEFTHGYRPRALVFYVSISNEHSEERFVKDEDISSWGSHWTTINIEFEAKLVSSPHFKFLYSRMFFICDGNHRFKAWTCCIKRLHSNDQKWHYFVDNIYLDAQGKEGLLLNAMNDNNK